MSKMSSMRRKLGKRRVRVALQTAKYDKMKKDLQNEVQVKVSQVEEGTADKVPEVQGATDQTGCAAIQST